MSRTARVAALLTVLSGASAPEARAEPGDDPYRGFLILVRRNFEAEIVDAYAHLVEARARAELIHQEAESKRLDNALKSDKLRLWRYQNMPTAEELKWDKSMVRVQRTPPINEILSAGALNTLLDDVKLIGQKGVQARDGKEGRFPPGLDLKLVHVTCHKGNIGPLRKGVLDWPLLLWRPDFNEDRERLDRLATKAYEQAVTQASGDRVRVIEEMERAAVAMEEKMFQLSKKPGGQASATMYMDAKKFFRQFEEMIEALRQPNAGDYLSGRYEARGNTVAELVRHMVENGLRFAPATPGSENAYVVLHRCMAAYSLELREARYEKRVNSTPPGFNQP